MLAVRTVIEKLVGATIPQTVLILGNNNSGTTTFLYRLKLNEIVKTIPTIGINVETIERPYGNFVCWDIGEGCGGAFGPMIRFYMNSNSAILFMIDVSHRNENNAPYVWSFEESFSEDLKELGTQASMAEGSDVPYLAIVFNKYDQPWVTDELVASCKDRVISMMTANHGPPGVRRGTFMWEFFGTRLSAYANEGLDEVCEKLLRDTKTVKREGKAEQESKLKTAAELYAEERKSVADSRPKSANLLKRVKDEAAHDSFNEPAADFLLKMAEGKLETWDHRAHLKAAYYVLLVHLKAGRGVFDAVDDFLGRLDSMLRSAPPGKFRNTVHKTMTTFWMQVVQLALLNFNDSEKRDNFPETNVVDFQRLLEFCPELMWGGQWGLYYTKKLMMSPEAKQEYRLPDVKPLPIYIRGRRALRSFAWNFTASGAGPMSQSAIDAKKELAESDMVRRFAFTTLQTYLKTGQRRGLVIKEAMAIFQVSLMKERVRKANTDLAQYIPLYSETKLYFWIQMCHANAATLMDPTIAGRPDFGTMSYEGFVKLFPSLLNDNIWEEHYSRKVWNSSEARAQFVPPDRKALPDRLAPPSTEVIERGYMVETEVKAAGEWSADEKTTNDALTLSGDPSEDLRVRLFLKSVEDWSPATPALIDSHAKLVRYLYWKLTEGRKDGGSRVDSNELYQLSGASGVWLEGVTRRLFWTRIVFEAFESDQLANEKDIAVVKVDFGDYVRRHPEITSETLWTKHYSDMRWNSWDAEQYFVEPDKVAWSGVAQ